MTAPGGARAGDTGDAGATIVGVVPRRVVAPRTLDEAAEVIAACARAGERLAFVGGGTELGLGGAPEGLDVVLRTESLARVVEHAPLDQIVTIECGVRVAVLQRLLAAHGQMLALDPPWQDRATVGGVVATGAFGARRTRYGGVRDLIIGASFVRADGTRARAGGKVVKNVAGFDLPKLLAGSLGTLGFIATVTFRLHPLPEATATVLFPGGKAADVRRVMAAARAAQLEPEAAAVVVDPRPDAGSGDGWELGVRFAGFARAVQQQRDRLVAVGRALGLAAEPLDDDAGADLWLRHQEAREAPAPFRAKLAMLPGEPQAAALIERLSGVLRAPRAVFYPTLGLGFVAGDDGSARPGAGEGGGDPRAAEAVAALVDYARRQLAPTGGSVVLHEASMGVRARVDVWGSAVGPYPALPLMRSVKARLDPERRLAPGRFVGGI